MLPAPGPSSPGISAPRWPSTTCASNEKPWQDYSPGGAFFVGATDAIVWMRLLHGIACSRRASGERSPWRVAPLRGFVFLELGRVPISRDW